LLAVSSENLATDLQRLIKDDKIQEKEAFLSLLARKETPPLSIQNICNLEFPELLEVLDADGNLQVRSSFMRQSVIKKHWILDALVTLQFSDQKTCNVNIIFFRSP
jgi:hypothetical protein